MSDNKLEPVVLNEYNEGYGEKKLPFAWENRKQLFQKLYVPPFESGGYGYIIQNLEKDVMKLVATRPEKMDELDLVTLYLVGKSHLALGNEDAAIRCFKIIYSQIGFRKYILSEYHKYLAFAIDELENLAKTLGYDRVNSVSIPKVESKVAEMERKKERLLHCNGSLRFTNGKRGIFLTELPRRISSQVLFWKIFRLNLLSSFSADSENCIW